LKTSKASFILILKSWVERQSLSGTRVPLQNLIDYLEGGESFEDFLDGFPSVKREQAIAVIEAAKLMMLQTI
jgi:uncharacterized protein (DUF433 family)